MPVELMVHGSDIFTVLECNIPPATKRRVIR